MWHIFAILPLIERECVCIKHIEQIHHQIKSAQGKAIEELKSLLFVNKMRLATLRFKLELESDTDENLNSFYGVGYVFQTLIESGISEKEFFLNHGKLVVGRINGEEECWLSLGDWYIYADGYANIDWTLIKDSDYVVEDEVPARDIYERFFAPRTKLGRDA